MPIRNSTAPLESAPSRHWRKLSVYLVLYGAAFVLLATKSVPCAFAKAFHTPCPGCGSTRAVVALATGDIDGFLHANPLGVPMAILAGVIAVDSLRSVFLHGDFRGMAPGVHKVVVRGVLVVAVLEFALWIARFFGAFGGPVPV